MTQKSVIKNAIIKDTKNFKYKLYNLMGGINFYKSNIEINNLEINNSYSEDQINFINTNFNINNSIFSNSISDSIDSDFSKGTIKNSKFNNIQGDAIDTSGSIVELENIKIKNVFDKGLSIGEGSIVKGKNIEVIDSGVGVAIKDSSNLELKNFSSLNSFIADILSVNKKDFFGKSIARIFTSKIMKDKTSIIGLKNEIYLNDELLPTQNIDAKELYQLERMKKNAI